MSVAASKIDKKEISILGCGWLGIALAQRLAADPITSALKCSTTSDAKSAYFTQKGWQGFQLPLTPDFDAQEADIQAFFDSDTLLVSLPPRIRKNEAGFYQKQIETVVGHIRQSKVTEVIFISSTSIYPDLNRIVVEDDVTFPEESPAAEMVLAENLIASLRPERNVCILRFGGLLGDNRIPGKYVQGQQNLTTGEVPVNYIHRDDGAALIRNVIREGVQNETFNIVAPLHPVRRDIYLKTCAEFGWVSPTFQEGAVADFKIISNEKFLKYYPYEFSFPDPLTFRYSLEDPLAF